MNIIIWVTSIITDKYLFRKNGQFVSVISPPSNIV